MFQKVLVANRGEIAVRVIQSLRELGIASVAVYSTADRHSLAVKLADEAICIGDSPAVKSYLNMQNIVSAAILTGADAIHPGFGFLSENALFAQLCADAGIIFIGPKPETITRMGDKAQARATMEALAVPVIPGSHALTTLADAQAAAGTLGYPVMLKAAAGGGGKGIRLLATEAALRADFPAAQGEAKAAFGDDTMYLEKVITSAKHIEVQVLRDQAGHTTIFPERDCSLQRHSQKVVEESPCATLSAAGRAHLQQLARTIADGIDYLNAGTIEFLMDQEEHFYFMEMNTRIQVEHPITEMVTGVDLIAWQIQIAAGTPLTLAETLPVLGAAIECRVNAEDPARGFQPATGAITALRLPSGLGVRVDCGIQAGDTITPYYDAMLAKVIVHAATRQQALAKMQRALREFDLSGLQTNVAFQQALLASPAVLSGDTTTNYIGETFLTQWQSEVAG